MKIQSAAEAMKPPTGEMILSSYQGIFSDAFISLKPFYQLKPNSPKDILSGDYTSSQRRNVCSPIAWKTISNKTGLTINNIDRGLLTWIGALKKDFEDITACTILKRFVENSHIYAPEPDDFSDFQMSKIMLALLDFGYKNILLGDEWGTFINNPIILPLTNATIEGLDSRESISKSAKTYTPLRALYAEDFSFLYTTSFDCHFDILCSSKPILDRLVLAANLEGFFANSTTKLRWSLDLNEG